MADSSGPPPPGRDDDAPADGPSPGAGRGGFFSRILEALSPAEEEPARAPAGPGLGNLRRMRVEEIAVPKAEIAAVPVTVTLDGLVEAFRESGRTRMPVHEGSLDAPLGLVNLKDFALRHGFARGGGGSGEPFDLRGMLRPLLYVPPSMPLASLLARMQAERIHMALIIDEYGGTDGLLTLEDLLETVVGEIDDEHDVEGPATFQPEAEGVWIADGATDLIEFEREIGMDLTAHEDIDPEEADTLGGLVFLLSGHVPQPGEVVAHPDGPVFEVLDSDGRRIRSVRVRIPEAARSALAGPGGRSP